jgi:hypothetical protein
MVYRIPFNDPALMTATDGRIMPLNQSMVEEREQMKSSNA